MLPVYEQPPCPEPGWMWTPGYWAYDQDGYYWVPGTWVPAPYEGALWTPPYWGWEGGVYLFHPGYWGNHVGYYGGVNYGFGYMGIGFVGGMWRGHDFMYNTAVMRVDGGRIRNTYMDRGSVDRYTVRNDRRVAFSGGPGGINHGPTTEERFAERDRHVEATQFQHSHESSAMGDRSSYFRNNGGRPGNAAVARPLQRRWWQSGARQLQQRAECEPEQWREPQLGITDSLTTETTSSATSTTRSRTTKTAISTTRNPTAGITRAGSRRSSGSSRSRTLYPSKCTQRHNSHNSSSALHHSSNSSALHHSSNSNVLRHSSSRGPRRSNIRMQKGKKSTSIENWFLLRNEQGPRYAVGLVVSGGCELDAGDFRFEAAVVGVVVFADAVGDVDEAAAVSASSAARAARSHPTARITLLAVLGQSRLSRRGLLGKLKADVAFFHDARGGDQAHAASDEDGFGVAVAERLELAQPSGEHGRDAVQRQFGVNAEKTLGLARGQVFVGVEAQAALELGQRGGGQGKADGEGVAAEAGEEIGAALDGVEQVEAVDGAARAVGDAVFNADDDGGLGGALDDARGEDADDAAMPAFAIDDQQAVGS